MIIQRPRTVPGMPRKAASTEGNAIPWDGAEDVSTLRAIFNNSPDNIAVFAPDGRILLANPALLSYLGVTRSEVLGRTPTEIPTSFDLSKLQGLVVRVGRHAKRFRVEIPVDRSDDGAPGVHIVDLVPVPTSIGCIDHIIAYGRYVTNIDKLKASMVQAQDQLHAAIKVLPDIFWIKDVDG